MGAASTTRGFISLCVYLVRSSDHTQPSGCHASVDFDPRLNELKTSDCRPSSPKPSTAIGFCCAGLFGFHRVLIWDDRR